MHSIHQTHLHHTLNKCAITSCLKKLRMVVSAGREQWSDYESIVINRMD
jgi:hypothetical protein